MHELIQKEFKEKAIYLYQVATIFRMAIYHIQILEKGNNNEIFDNNICKIINNYYEKNINKNIIKSQKLDIFEDIKCVSIILTGVWTLSINAIHSIRKYEIKINKKHIPLNIIPIIYYQEIAEDTIICHSEFLNKELLDRAKYWSNIITENGYCINDKGQTFYFKKWCNLPEKYHTNEALIDYVRYISHNPEKAKYLNLKTHRYLYDIANGDLEGPGNITVSVLKKAGYIALTYEDDEILLINPINNYKVNSCLLCAKMDDIGIYHIDKKVINSLQVTKRADVRFSIN